MSRVEPPDRASRDYGLDVVDLFARYFADVDTVDLHAFDRDEGGRDARHFSG